MKNYRMVAVLAVFALLLGLIPASLAQDMTFGLSEADYNVLTAANAATAAANSAQFSFTANLTATAEGESGSINLTGTGAFDTAAGAFQLTLDGQADMGDGSGPQPLNAELRATGGSVYFMVPALLGPQWLSISPEEASMFMEGFSDSLPFDPTALASGDMSGLEGMEGMGDMTEALTALATLQPENYVSMTRNGDVFSTTVDVTGLLGSEEMQAFIRESMAANAEELEESGMTEAEINQMLASLPSALQGTNVTIDQHVTNGMVTRTVINFALNVDPTVFGETGDAANIALNFDISLSGFDQPVSIAAPADAMPLSQLFGGAS